MRVIRTEIIGENLRPNEAAGVAFAWFKTGSRGRLPDKVKLAQLVEDGKELSADHIREFVDLSAQNQERGYPLVAEGAQTRKRVRFREKVDNIVIERSPVDTIPIADFINLVSKSGGSTIVGGFLGWSVADSSTLMFLTVPAGILVVGSVMGVSRGIENGLAAVVERLFFKGDPPKPPHRPKRRRTVPKRNRQRAHARAPKYAARKRA